MAVKHETPFGDVVLEIDIENNKVVVESNVVFDEFVKEFPLEKIEEAKKFYKEYCNEVDKKIEEILRRREEKSLEKNEIFNKIINSINRGFSKILLYGPTGTGKTYLILKTLEYLKKEGKINDYLIITMSSGMEDIDLLGKLIPSKNGIRYVPSELWAFLREAQKENKKVAIVFDEFNRVSSKTLNLLIPMLDGRGGKVVLENYLISKRIEIPRENVIFLFSANFGGAYSGTFMIDEAIMNRIDIAIFVNYNIEYEDEYIDSNIINKDMVEFVKKFRDYLRNLAREGIIRPFSTRDLKNLVNILKSTTYNYEEIYNNSILILEKLVKNDHYGYPDSEILEDIKKFIKEIVNK